MTDAAPGSSAPPGGVDRLPNGLRALRSRDFRIFWGAALVSSVGSHMQLAALGWVVAVLTGSAAKVGLVAFATTVPLVVLSPVAGSLTDRIPRRRMLLVTLGVQTVQAATLGVTWALGVREYWLIVLLALLGGVGTAFNGPVFQAFVPELVPRTDLPNAVMLNSAQFNVAKAVGPLVAGVLLVEALGASWCFLANAVSFGAVMIAVAAIREGHHPPPSVARHGFWRDFVDGADHVRRSPGLRTAIGMNCLIAAVGQPLVPLIPVVALRLYRADSVTYGVLAGALGVGAVLGAVVAGRLDGRWRPSRILAWGLLGYAAFTACVAGAGTLALGLLAVTGAGAGFLVIIAVDNSCIQALAREPWRGRVIGIWLMCYGMAYPVGVLVQGWLADRIGLRPLLFADAAILAVVTAALLARGGLRSVDVETELV